MQHWDAARYRAWKRDLVVEALRQAGLDAPVADLIDAHGEGRRRAVFHARRGTHGVLEVGFSAARAHHLVAIDRCPILAPNLGGAIDAAWAIAEVLDPADKPLDIHVTATDAGLDIDVRGSGPLTAPLMTTLARVAATHDLARLTRHGELIALTRAPTLRMGRAIVPLPPAAFLQATAAGEAALARLVVTACSGAGRVADLFSGIGPFGLRLAERARVVAVDDDDDALAALKRAAASTAGLKPIDVEARDLFRRPLIGTRAEKLRCRRLRPAAAGRASAGARARIKRRAARCRGVVQSGNVGARLERTGPRRLSADRDHAGRSIPLRRPCRDRGAAGEVTWD